MSARFTDRKLKRRKDKVLHSFKVARDGVWAFLQVLGHFKPKTDEEFFSARDVRRALKPHLEEQQDGLSVRVSLKVGEEAEVRLEGAAFRLLERIFKEAREGGVFTGHSAEVVVDAMERLKAAAKVEEAPAAQAPAPAPSSVAKSPEPEKAGVK